MWPAKAPWQRGRRWCSLKPPSLQLLQSFLWRRCSHQPFSQHIFQQLDQTKRIGQLKVWLRKKQARQIPTRAKIAVVSKRKLINNGKFNEFNVNMYIISFMPIIGAPPIYKSAAAATTTITTMSDQNQQLQQQIKTQTEPI